MSNINFTRNQLFWQRATKPQEGFLCIELLQGLLVLGVLLLLVTAFHVLSVHWQHQAIKRFEALDLIATEFVLGEGSKDTAGMSAPTIQVMIHKKEILELSSLVGKPVVVEQKVVTALWQDERKRQHTLRMVS